MGRPTANDVCWCAEMGEDFCPIHSEKIVIELPTSNQVKIERALEELDRVFTDPPLKELLEAARTKVAQELSTFVSDDARERNREHVRRGFDAAVALLLPVVEASEAMSATARKNTSGPMRINVVSVMEYRSVHAKLRTKLQAKN
jgi:hypothetical protein